MLHSHVVSKALEIWIHKYISICFVWALLSRVVFTSRETKQVLIFVLFAKCGLFNDPVSNSGYTSIVLIGSVYGGGGGTEYIL
jgi:hypothetical protein